MGDGPEPIGRQAALFKRGHVLEDALLEWGAREVVEAGHADSAMIEFCATRPHPHHDWSADSTDALYLLAHAGANELELACSEAKTVQGFMSSGWGESWGDEIPRAVRLQCHWHLGHHPDTLRCYVPALVGFAMELRIYAVERDEEIEGVLFETAERWHREYVVANRPPPVQSEKDSEVLARLFPLGAGEIPDDPRIEALVRRHCSLQDMIRPMDKERDLIGAQIQELLGEAELCRGEWGKASWKNSKAHVWTDWDAVMAELREIAAELPGSEQFNADLDELIARNTHSKPGSRRLLTSIKKEK